MTNSTYPSGADFYYIRNGQNDITGILDSNGYQVVTYTYDSWGKLLSTTGSLASTVGVKNPYRYRGYRYDVETGLYYLNSRYYNPEWGRFINADAVINRNSLIGCNLFTYCLNNPVMLSDSSGMFIDGGVISGPLLVIIFIVVCIIAIISIYAMQFMPITSTRAIKLPRIFILIQPEPLPTPEPPPQQENNKYPAPYAPLPTQDTNDDQGQYYYHVTSASNAADIIRSGYMKPGEENRVFAWRRQPDTKALRICGARGDITGCDNIVIIVFKTNAAFTTDKGIEDPYAKTFSPVKTYFEGGIRVSDVYIVRSYMR